MSTSRIMKLALIATATLAATIGLAGIAHADDGSGSTLPNGGYNATSRNASGTDGTVTYDVTMPAVTGPNQAVVDAFNNTVDASFHQQITALQNDSIPAEWTLTTNQNQQAVWLGNNTVSGLWVTRVDTPHEAHGSYHVATFVINKTTAQPVMLADVFGDFGLALQRLSQNATTQLSAKLGDGFRPDGVAPAAENFANWVPTSDGIELHFDDYQVGPHGLLAITVPWAVFDGIPINNVP
jgi:hypothetical protein